LLRGLVFTVIGFKENFRVDEGAMRSRARACVVRFAVFSILVSAALADEIDEPDQGKTVSSVPYDKPGAFSVFQPVVRQADFVGVSPPLSELAAPGPRVLKNVPPHIFPIGRRPPPAKLQAAAAVDPVLQAFTPSLAMPSPLLTFDGVSENGYVPPDTNGDVGPSNYVQFVNILYQVYDKSTGTALTPPLKLSSLFASCGCACGAGDAGDPIALYDPLADRWLLSQFTNPSVTPYHQCIAISQTGDPTGAYYIYSFQMPNTAFNDYPKFGVWPDGYYMSDNQFGTFGGAGAFAFDRSKMLVGDPTATYIYFNLATFDASIFSLLPSDVDGPPPPVGTPNYFTYFISNALRTFRFHADFSNPTASTFTELPESPIAVAPFTALPFSASISQPNTTQLLDGLGDRLMYRLQYRNFDGFESLVVNHSVSVGSQSGVRYYQLRRPLPGGSFSVYDQATFAPADGLSRWMGSAALDGQTNFAVGYSVSGTNQFPSIRYAGRLASDPTNSLSQGETTLQAGGGSQTGTERWGDYSMLAIDPNDDCTFWYTTEYYTNTDSFAWHTRIGSFQFPGCTPSPKGTLFGTVTDATSGLPISVAVVKTDFSVRLATPAHTR
jgi:hypothetical protein